MKTKLIAEAGINHNGDISLVKKLIDLADLAGYKYIKFQKRTPDICVPEKQKNKIKITPWGKITYLEYKKKIEFEEEQYNIINEYCKNKDINWFVSVWDIESAKFMSKYPSVRIVKLPSAHLTNCVLGKYCRENFEKVLVSTGMSTEEEIQNAIDAYEPDVIFHTNSTYPTPIEELNLGYIKWLQEKYPTKEIGFSSHDYGVSSSVIAMAMGCKWIENHITLSHELWGSDQKSSKDPAGTFAIYRRIAEMEKSLGGYEERKVYESEKEKREALRGE